MVEQERPWFVRRSRGLGYNLMPVRIEGWLLTLGYCLAVTGLSLLATLRNPEYWYVWATLIVALTFLFVLAAFRNSAPKRGDR